ncbi:dipicolinic acid synthetase subunit A [Terribacillus saccharophilus]|uniref:Dipicolinic acid synthetase subunit A n=1 Tax=Terribacillus saccharophilus TaxID=361277 RepID=A0ABX4H3U2_9BACI|nr:dipicolinic acid synthetase subunit A [Terribacillus saccharophilus]PAD97921.1 dipicolinic acid synthetase subunit A [Terribacillus saccharophilus]PAE01689.1 dipicolinic acid synthetase subunit A [Terribacillus saccharophilus]
MKNLRKYALKRGESLTTELTIAVLGGDARYLEMIRSLQCSANASVFAVGFEQISQSFTGGIQRELEDIDPQSLDAVILPIPGVGSNGQIETVFSDKNIQLTESWIDRLPKDCVIFTGITNDYLTELFEKRNLRLVSLFDRDDVAIYNSIPTAEGAIMTAIKHTDFTIHGSNVVVLGFGRVGKSVASKFNALGAIVQVGSIHDADIARISEMGMRAFFLDRLPEKVKDTDILINTIPALVVKRAIIEQLPVQTLIIDLASKPGGVDFDYAKKRGIEAIHALSLPGIVAPKTAGNILSVVIKQILINS